MLAASAANLDNKPGRDWRSTEDTAIAASILRGGNPAWANWKRGQDYYQEGELLWLDADTLIRKLTNDKKSLTDFQHIFLGKGGNTGPLIVPYNREELIADLNQVVPYDWATFLHERIDNINPHADLAGIERGGYKLVYIDKPNRLTSAATAGARGAAPAPNVWYSLGLRLERRRHVITDVRWAAPPTRPSSPPARRSSPSTAAYFTADAPARRRRRTPRAPPNPSTSSCRPRPTSRTVDIDYHDGERYPVLQRIDGTPALLDDITKPLSPQTVLPKPGATPHRRARMQ